MTEQAYYKVLMDPYLRRRNKSYSYVALIPSPQGLPEWSASKCLLPARRRLPGGGCTTGPSITAASARDRRGSCSVATGHSITAASAWDITLCFTLS